MLPYSKMFWTALIVSAICLGSVFALAPISSAASSSPTTGPTLLFKPFNTPPGATVQVTGKNFFASGVKFTLQSCDLAGNNCKIVYTGTTSSGGFVFSYTVPLSAAVGNHFMKANDSANE